MNEQGVPVKTDVTYRLTLINRIIWCLKRSSFTTSEFIRECNMRRDGASCFLAALEKCGVIKRTRRFVYSGRPQVWKRNGVKIEIDQGEKCRHGLFAKTCLWCRSNVSEPLTYEEELRILKALVRVLAIIINNTNGGLRPEQLPVRFAIAINKARAVYGRDLTKIQ